MLGNRAVQEHNPQLESEHQHKPPLDMWLSLSETLEMLQLELLEGKDQKKWKK